MSSRRHLGARRQTRLRKSTLASYHRFAQAALLPDGTLSHHVKRWTRSSRKQLKTALHRLGFRRAAVEVQL